MPNTKKVTVDQLNTVAVAIASKSDARFAKQTDFSTVSGKVTTIEGTLDGNIGESNLSTTLKNTIDGKANSSDLGSLAGLSEVVESNLGTDLANKINGKADSSSIGDVAALDEIGEEDLSTTLANKINGKANSADLGDLASKSTVGTSDLTQELASTISGKADAADIGDVAALDEIAEANLNGDLANKINGKANTADLGALASKSTVGTSDLDASLAASITAKADADNVYTKAQTDAAIASAVSAADHLKRKVVANKAEMDTYLADDTKTDRDQYIYCVPKGGQDGGYDEYLAVLEGSTYVANKVGDWEVDLSTYATKTEVESATEVASSSDIQAIVNGIWPASNNNNGGGGGE